MTDTEKKIAYIKANNLITAARIVAEKMQMDDASEAIHECLLQASNLLTKIFCDEEN